MVTHCMIGIQMSLIRPKFTVSIFFCFHFVFHERTTVDRYNIVCTHNSTFTVYTQKLCLFFSLLFSSSSLSLSVFLTTCTWIASMECVFLSVHTIYFLYVAKSIWIHVDEIISTKCNIYMWLHEVHTQRHTEKEIAWLVASNRIALAIFALCYACTNWLAEKKVSERTVWKELCYEPRCRMLTCIISDKKKKENENGRKKEEKKIMLRLCRRFRWKPTNGRNGR